jgi:hypothetical protein
MCIYVKISVVDEKLHGLSEDLAANLWLHLNPVHTASSHYLRLKPWIDYT